MAGKATVKTQVGVIHHTRAGTKVAGVAANGGNHPHTVDAGDLILLPGVGETGHQLPVDRIKTNGAVLDQHLIVSGRD